MKTIKSAALVLAVLAVLAGISIVFAGGSSQTRDYERNVYIVESSVSPKIQYSIVQAKQLMADIDGISEKQILVEQGDTVKLEIDSKVYCDFTIEGYDVKARTQPNTKTEVAFNADIQGEFKYTCAGFLGGKSGTIKVV